MKPPSIIRVPSTANQAMLVSDDRRLTIFGLKDLYNFSFECKAPYQKVYLRELKAFLNVNGYGATVDKIVDDYIQRSEAEDLYGEDVAIGHNGCLDNLQQFYYE